MQDCCRGDEKSGANNGPRFIRINDFFQARLPASATAVDIVLIAIIAIPSGSAVVIAAPVVHLISAVDSAVAVGIVHAAVAAGASVFSTIALRRKRRRNRCKRRDA